MKKAILVLVVFFSGQFGFAQGVEPTSPKAEDNSLYATGGIEVKPEFPGGLQEFYNFIGKNFKTPNVRNLKGKVYTTFVIEKDGSISDVKVIKDIGYGTAEEAIRVLKMCPKWIPGEQNGEKVRVQYALPIAIQNP